MQIVFTMILFGFLLGSLCDVVVSLVHFPLPGSFVDEAGALQMSGTVDGDNVKGPHRV